MRVHSPIGEPLEHLAAWETHRGARVGTIALVSAAEQPLAERFASLLSRLHHVPVVEHNHLDHA